MSGTWLPEEEDPRAALEQSGPDSDLREVLVDYLATLRMTFELKCQDLDAEQLARRSVPPSTLSLLGLLRHLAKVEQIWFRIRLAGQDEPWHYCGTKATNDPAFTWDGDFDGAVADDEVVADAWVRWRDEVAFGERFVREAESLDVRTTDGSNSLRGILVHLIQEYARHCGHADLLRECVDGRTGA